MWTKSSLSYRVRGFINYESKGQTSRRCKRTKRFVTSRLFSPWEFTESSISTSEWSLWHLPAGSVLFSFIVVEKLADKRRRGYRLQARYFRGLLYVWLLAKLRPLHYFPRDLKLKISWSRVCAIENLMIFLVEPKWLLHCCGNMFGRTGTFNLFELFGGKAL